MFINVTMFFADTFNKKKSQYHSAENHSITMSVQKRRKKVTDKINVGEDSMSH